VLDNADNADILLGTGDAKGIVDYLPESEEGMTIYTIRTQEVAAYLNMNRMLVTKYLQPLRKHGAGPYQPHKQGVP